MIRLPRVYPILDSDALDRRGIALEAAAAAFLEGGAASCSFVIRATGAV